MEDHFTKVLDYLAELGFHPATADAEKRLCVVNEERRGIVGLVIDCEFPILVMEQIILNAPNLNKEAAIRLLQMNRTIVHGAFCLDESGKKVIFRDTLRLETLDLAELQGSLESLAMALAEHSAELLRFARS